MSFFFKYRGIYLTYQAAICLTNAFIALIIIKNPNRRPSVNHISPDLLADIWTVKLCQQPHLSNHLFKAASPVYSSLLCKNNQLCTTPHMQAMAYYSR